MNRLALDALPDLYELDETAWLDTMAGLAREGRATELDLPHLAEYLADMAKRERREVESRLVVLLAHVLKWRFQPRRRSRSWRVTIIEHRQELELLVGRGILQNHAEEALSRSYARAVERAAAETGLAAGRFPAECPYSVEQLLTVDLTSLGG